jgi:general secretion pathway protein K
MNAARARSQRGIALIMVLVALTILGSMTADLMETNDVYLSTTVNSRDAVRAEYLARSGVNLARLLLSFQKIIGQTANFPFWQYADMVIGMFASSDGGSMLTDMAGLDLSEVEGLGLGIPDSDLKVSIIDEDSKLNINMSNDRGRGKYRERLINQLTALLAPPEYDHLFDREAIDGKTYTREEIICEIVDWTDPDEDLCDRSGTEDRSIYQALTPQYERKNAPFDSLAELHMLAGIGDDFWSAFVEPDSEDPSSRVMTIWGKGNVNVNTAPTQVLLPLICMTATGKDGMNPCLGNVETMFNLHQILQGLVFIRTFMPFKKDTDFISAVEDPEKYFLPLPGFPILDKKTAKLVFTARSSVFSIYSEGTVGRVTKRLHVVVTTKPPTTGPTPPGGTVLYWRME